MTDTWPSQAADMSSVMSVLREVGHGSWREHWLIQGDLYKRSARCLGNFWKLRKQGHLLDFKSHCRYSAHICSSLQTSWCLNPVQGDPAPSAGCVSACRTILGAAHHFHILIWYLNSLWSAALEPGVTFNSWVSLSKCCNENPLKLLNWIKSPERLCFLFSVLRQTRHLFNMQHQMWGFTPVWASKHVYFYQKCILTHDNVTFNTFDKKSSLMFPQIHVWCVGFRAVWRWKRCSQTSASWQPNTWRKSAKFSNLLASFCEI